MDADDDEFVTTNNDSYGLEDDELLFARWEEMLPPGITDDLIQCIDFCLCISSRCHNIGTVKLPVLAISSENVVYNRHWQFAACVVVNARVVIRSLPEH